MLKIKQDELNRLSETLVQLQANQQSGYYPRPVIRRWVQRPIGKLVPVEPRSLCLRGATSGSSGGLKVSREGKLISACPHINVVIGGVKFLV